YLQWMRSLDVYCCLSSGEGWSVTPREALHLGKPVIVLDAHVHAGFSHLPGVIPVAAGTPREASHGLKWVDGDVGHEAGVDREALAAVLRDLPRHWRQQCLALRARFGEVIDHHDPDKTRARWIEVLNALCGSAA